MARTLQEEPITTPSARSKLVPGLYWRRLDTDVHLGYRKGKRTGNWLVRWRKGKGYQQVALGTADDVLKEGTLAFSKAEVAARSIVENARIEEQALAEGPPLTVRRAIENYIDLRDKRATSRAGRTVRSDASQRLQRHVLGVRASGAHMESIAAPLAEIGLHRLSESDLRNWVAGLPAELKTTTVKRMVNDLKAALNQAVEINRDRLPPSLPGKIKVGLRVHVDESNASEVARDDQILSDAQVSSLLAAAREVDKEQELDGDLYRMVLVLAATGARFSQVARMTIADMQVAQRRLLVPRSRKGNGVKSGSIAVPVGQDIIDALMPISVGRAAKMPLLERWHYERAGRLAWKKSRRGAWGFAFDLTPLWVPIRERVGIPGVIPYALRHSSIVRGIRANLPIRLVAALHDTSVEMIERHYSRWIVDGLDELAASAVVPLVPQLPSDGANVVLLGGDRRL